ncbi:hypothetical protein [Desulfatiferula olefinivorans]
MNRPAGRDRVSVTPPAVKVSLTAMGRVLISKVMAVQLKVRPDTTVRSSGAITSFPARPWGVIRREPVGILTANMVWPSLVRFSSTLETATLTTRLPAAVVICSKLKLPERLWPMTVKMMSVPSTRR